MLDNFHFLRPLWLLAFFALLFILWQLKKLRLANSAWQRIVPKHLNRVLLASNETAKPIALLPILLLGSVLIVALAGPTWNKLPQPVYQTDKASVIVMDMSFSMLATDTKPNRLTRARFKALDLLEKVADGDVGLIAYAGDAFVISPLTEDINNIRLLLPSLSPQIMPELGSNPYPALILAHEMLFNAGYQKGDIYWLTDGIDSDDLQDINEFGREHEHSINILGIGTEQGAPITLDNGELMRDRGGSIVIPKLNGRMLAGISERNDGNYQTIRNDDEDIEDLTSTGRILSASESQEQEVQGDQWQESGPYLLLIALPLILFYCRKGILLSLALPCLLCASLFTPAPVQASIWDDLWKRTDQQAQEKFEQQDFSAAASQFKQPAWKASAQYKAGDYEKALEAFSQLKGIDAKYNEANTLAKMRRFEDAIKAYDDVLAQVPEHADALANKALVEQLLDQQNQDQQNQDQQNQDQQNQDQQNQDQQNQDQQNQDQQNQDQQNQEQQNQDQQNQDQKNQDQQNQDQQNQDQQNQDQQNQDQQNQDQQNQDQQNQDQQNQDRQNQDQQNSEQSDSEHKEPEPEGANQTEQDEQQSKSEQPGQAQEAQAQLTEQELEQQQKHQQILKKVTDDPNLLLRNKMRLEYRKRRQNRSSIGVKEKW
ncbi:VWA domain-containing protein [Thalassotalea litorea]|uniref:VWA domain-containing protein n=1 Tax=Thalassotalea litorea TaxID=2020715 RepID=A0A5R9IQ60_9GAMM|nr:VWA domain-containing protein [Thalassotalea litorea]TLU67670.1 VWA domain-containing protein [Thalassotalea litorea]